MNVRLWQIVAIAALSSLICSLNTNAVAQTYTWMHGDSVVNSSPIFGTKGIPGQGNNPCTRGGCFSWTDMDGNFWIFGGVNGGYRSDLWKYEPVTNEWTWINGDSTVDSYGNYGIRGIASSSNTPGARSEGIFWTDKAGDFWMFGGVGLTASNYGYLNDLWRYTPATNQWTWVSGDSTSYSSASYGIQGLPDPSNKPSGRIRAASWVDSANRLWLFGGRGKPWHSNMGPLNDLWLYDPLSNQWTWMKGSNDINAPDKFGIQNVASPLYGPGGTDGAVSWTDRNNNLWLFSGGRMWKYKPASNQWTFVKGDTVSGKGYYGVLGVEGVSNTPDARTLSFTWKDNSGHFWLYGGNGNKNDLWKFKPESENWTMVRGDFSNVNMVVNYGVLGVMHPDNQPGGRADGASWADKAGNLWMFGGTGIARSKKTSNLIQGLLNDLWKITLPVLSVREVDNRPQLTIFPSPANDKLVIERGELNAEAGTLTIFDLNGREIYRQKLLKTRTNTLEVSVADLLPGAYIVEVTTPTTRLTEKFLKL